MKYIVAFLLLFALTTELHLKTKLQCKKSGENCFMDFECCDDLICDEGIKLVNQNYQNYQIYQQNQKNYQIYQLLGKLVKVVMNVKNHIYV